MPVGRHHDEGIDAADENADVEGGRYQEHLQGGILVGKYSQSLRVEELHGCDGQRKKTEWKRPHLRLG